MNNYLKLKGVDIILIIGLYFLGNLIIYPVYYLGYIFSFDPYLLTPVMVILNYSFTFIIYYFIALKPRKEKYRFHYSFTGFGLFPVVLLLFFGQYLISEFLTGLIPTKGPIFGSLYQTMTHALLGNMEKNPAINFTMLCLIAPVCEELFFRGFILKEMLNNKVEPFKAILISSLIFGGIHFFPWQVVGGILSGLILGLTFYKTGSLLSCTLLHFINNFAGFLLFTKYKSLETPDLGINPFLLLFIGIILVLIFGYLYLKFTKNHTWKSY